MVSFKYFTQFIAIHQVDYPEETYADILKLLSNEETFQDLDS